MRSGIVRDLALHVGCLLLGAAVAVCGIAVHGSAFPLGLLLGLVPSYATAWWLTTSVRRRSAASYAVGWLVVLGVAVLGRREGDVALAADLAGYAFVVTGLGHVVVGVVSLAGSRPPTT